MKTVALEKSPASLRRLVDAAQSGEEIVITNHQKPVARIVPVLAPAHPRRKAGTLKGEVWMAPDFDAPLDDFKEYVE